MSDLDPLTYSRSPAEKNSITDEAVTERSPRKYDLRQRKRKRYTPEPINAKGTVLVPRRPLKKRRVRYGPADPEKYKEHAKELNERYLRMHLVHKMRKLQQQRSQSLDPPASQARSRYEEACSSCPTSPKRSPAPSLTAAPIPDPSARAVKVEPKPDTPVPTASSPPAFSKPKRARPLTSIWPRQVSSPPSIEIDWDLVERKRDLNRRVVQAMRSSKSRTRVKREPSSPPARRPNTRISTLITALEKEAVVVPDVIGTNVYKPVTAPVPCPSGLELLCNEALADHIVPTRPSDKIIRAPVSVYGIKPKRKRGRPRKYL